MLNLSKFLKPIRININNVLLDPNNPRFSELGEELIVVPEARYADEKVQANTFEKMKDDSFDVNELKDTIKTIGFLPVDRIIVKKWNSKNENDKYIVVEGNRRISALKWLIELHQIGKENFTPEQLQNFSQLDCLLLDDKLAPASAFLILPGLRHVSGVKEWGPYQKAKAIFVLRKSGMSPQDSAQSLGLSTRTANQAYRCYLGLEQMKADEEFGEFAEPQMYSYFEEALKRPNVKKWLGWDDSKEQFINLSNINEFFSWMVSTENNSPKLPEAKSVRELAQFLDDENAFKIFRSPEGSISRALAKYETDHPEDWYPKILIATDALKSLTPDMLRNMDEKELEALNQLRNRVDLVLDDRNKLKK
ncbi:MAG TPA: ParB/Srx family N-terminal domain-containing protein [bacterium]|nr:ParB/Srx family N-terminal domain-containing protein [bacterium]HPN44984.1 ParB/Srx family N-terminal domain-containing protein [bacterium]